MVGKIAFFVSLIAQVIIRYPYRNNGKGKPTDPQEQILLVVLTLGGAIIPLIYIFTGWLDFANYDAPVWVTGIGLIVMVIGLWLFWRAHTDLGRNWSSSLEIYENHALITQGIYQRIRHPMYAASWVLNLALVFLFSNWIAGFSGIVSFALLYFLRVPKEEEMMLKQFGDQYQQYMAKTGRIIPKLG